ncbi:uncharacterized protein MONBRDRAFT_38764 [Monosiga brevicollis MX1]|uniref:Uncharacterized protein n=1 Tax=Monosiga brevicollis TaxID=81824 RepID=A9V9Z7_MONBE|nr:uncharacterized protein MONBRDRAFT_38764 [Monosiga brevicollis MX1]EDQ85576.1 predicted protein [Monosiga brevicollis MX1]|eukprot:XP_001749525.1 hypothetical protein [Monosiga brevicollis MX1]
MGGWTSREATLRPLLTGLDAAGKTTLLYRLDLEGITHEIPTIGFTLQRLRLPKKRTEFVSFDVGGRGYIRPLARHFFQAINSIIFVVDGNDSERLDAAWHELRRLLEEESLAETPLLILVNKQDVPQALPLSKVVASLQNAKYHRHFRGRRVLELGSGCGLLGIGLAMLGAHVTLTDMGDEVIQGNLRSNARLNWQDDLPTTHTVKVEPLDWTQPEAALERLEMPYDLVVATDVVYKEQDVPPLVHTLETVVRPGGLAWVTNEDRNHTATQQFLDQLSVGFVVKHISLSKLDAEFQHETLYMLQLRRRRDAGAAASEDPSL